MTNTENFQTFKKNNWELILNLQGGKIAYLSHDNKSVLGSFTRLDGKEGSTHLCLPNFAAEGEEKYGLPFHGYARNDFWKYEGDRHDLVNISTLIKSTNKYPSDLFVTQRFTLSTGYFQQEITVINQGKKAVPVNVGIHNYWSTLQGWEGLAINGFKVADLVRENGYINVGKKNTLVFPIGLKIDWELDNFNRAVLWTSQKDNHFNVDFVCIEPVREYAADYFGSSKSLLHPNKTLTCSQKIIL